MPDIQRPFVWKDAKVRDLFDSIYRGFPIGSYLLWRNAVSGKTHQIGTAKNEHDDPVLLIIDGQQRLTALYAVFRNQAVKDESYENRKIAIAFNPVTHIDHRQRDYERFLANHGPEQTSRFLLEKQRSTKYIFCMSDQEWCAGALL